MSWRNILILSSHVGALVCLLRAVLCSPGGGWGVEEPGFITFDDAQRVLCPEVRTLCVTEPIDQSINGDFTLTVGGRDMETFTVAFVVNTSLVQICHLVQVTCYSRRYAL